MPANIDLFRSDISLLMKKGSFNDIIDRCHVELTHARRDRHVGVEIAALLGLAEAQCSLGHFEFARDYATQAVELAENTRAIGLYVDALNVRARINREGYFHTITAYEDYILAVNVAHEAGDMKRYALSVLGLGEISAQVGESIKHAWKVIDLAREMNDSQLEARAALLLSNAFLRRGEYDKAGDGLAVALELARKVGDRLLESVILGQQGLVFVQKEETYQKGLEQLLTALEVARGMEAVFHEFMRLYTLGMSTLARQELEASRGYFDQMLALAQDINHKPYEMYALGMLGHWQEVNQNHELAISHYDEAADVARQIANPHYEARYLYSVGAVYLKQWNFEMAREYYNRAKDLYQSLDDSSNAARVTASIVYSYVLAFFSRFMKLFGITPDKGED